VTVKKVWDDAENQDGKRPETLTVTLSNGKEVTLSEANNWTATIENLPKYKDGKEITYTWTEGEMPEGYTLTDTSVEGQITTLTNSYEPELVSVTVRKVWDDADNQDGKRPETLTVTLSNGEEVTLSEANNWTATITDLPKYKDGEEIAYTWTEGEMPEGYELSDTSVEGQITTLTNSYTPELTSVTVKKVWNDAENQDGKRPESLTVTLSNGEEVTLSEANNWTATVENLPKYEDGEEITYTWTEGEMPEGYELSDTSVNGTITTLTNSYEPEETEATVRKVWDDAENQDGKRPETLTVTLSNGEEVTLSEANGWEATITDLPKYEDGEEIAYTWTEGEMPEGYELTNTSVNGTITTLTNTYGTETTQAAVRKIWVDRDNQGNSRPDSLVVKLLADGEETGLSVTLDESGNWYAELKDLAKYNAGEEISYTWAEVDVPDYYQQTGSVVEGTLTTITNTYAAQGMIQFAGTKTIEGRRMTEKDVFTFEILEGEEQIATVTNDADGKIAYPVIRYTLDDVGEHVYTIRETSTSGNGITVDTAVHTVKVIVTDNGDGTLQVMATRNYNALDFVNTYDADISLTLQAFKTVDGKEPTANQVYAFVCQGTGERADEVLTAENDGGSISFGAIRFSLEDAGKTFVYTIRETTESGEFLLADDAVYTVYLTVKDNGDGTLGIDHVIEKNGEPADTVVFDNHRVAPLTIGKMVEGTVTDETFSMVVCFFDEEGNELAETFTYTGDAQGTIASGGSIELGHDQRVTIHGLPVGAQYTVREEGGLAYTATVNGEEGRETDGEIAEDGNLVSFVNTMETVSFCVTKIWEDGRSDDIQLTLYADGEKMDPQPPYTRQNNQYVYENLPKYNDRGEMIVYTAKEKGIEGYITIYYNIAPYEEETKRVHDGGTIVNKPEMELSFKIRKIWKNMDGEKPPKIELKLYCNGVELDVPTPTPDRDGWYKYYNLPKYVDGELAVYTVVEVSLGGYATFYEDENGNLISHGVHGGTIINSKMPKTGDHTSLAAWMAMLLCCAGAIGVLYRRKKNA
ncbi:MAG: Cna B-type domain-containing protein, partial [Clostridia bacterium]|nr:Cna B-type domain-containing protein [Clostridia bacterium]